MFYHIGLLPLILKFVKYSHVNEVSDLTRLGTLQFTYRIAMASHIKDHSPSVSCDLDILDVSLVASINLSKSNKTAIGRPRPRTVSTGRPANYSQTWGISLISHHSPSSLISPLNSITPSCHTLPCALCPHQNVHYSGCSPLQIMWSPMIALSTWAIRSEI